MIARLYRLANDAAITALVISPAIAILLVAYFTGALA